jgi:uncharacterized membrane protein
MALSPWQLFQAFLLICTMSLAVAGGFWLFGVRLVGLFAGLELLAVGVACWVVARHACDHETIQLSAREVSVECRDGQAVSRTSFRTEWVRVEPLTVDGSLVELSGEGRSVRVGRHVCPSLRLALATELRRALCLVRSAGERVVDHEHKA